MKTSLRPRIHRSVTLLTLCCILPGCKKDQEQNSLNTLTQKGLSLTPDDFVRTAATGNVDTIKQYLDAGVAVDVPDSSGSTALIQAAKNGRSGAVTYLLQSGAQVDAADAQGRTALIWAASEGQSDIIKNLLAAKAIPTKRDAQGFSALTAATYAGKPDAVDVLAPVSPTYLDQSLHIASTTGDVAVMSKLLAHGASVFARSREDKTPLMWAAGQGHMDAVNLLLQNGATRQATSGDNKTAAEIALDAGHKDIYDALMDPNYVPTNVPSEIAASAPSAVVQAPGQSLPTLETSTVTAAEVAQVAPAAAQPPEPVQAAERAPQPQPIRLDKQILPQPKPLPVATNGQAKKISLPDSLVLQRYEEAEMPLHLNKVEGSTAVVSVRPDPATGSVPTPVTVPVRTGETITGTPYKVTKVSSRSVVSKMSLGQEVDVSEISVQDTRNGKEYRVVKDQTARTDETRAVLRDPATGQLFDVRVGDEFASQDGTSFRVADIRSNAVVVEDLTHGGTHTIDRGSL